MNIARLILKVLLFVVGGIAYFRGVAVITHDWGWSSIPAVIAVFVPPVPVFAAPLYEGLARGDWTSVLMFYGAFVAIGVPFSFLEGRYSTSQAKVAGNPADGPASVESND